MENQVLAVAYSKIKTDYEFSFHLPKEFAEIVTEIIISFDPSLHKTIMYPRSLAGLPTRIINKNNLTNESYKAFRKSKVIFISDYIDLYLSDILKELPLAEGYCLSPDDRPLTKIKNKIFFFDVIEKLPKEITVENLSSNFGSTIYPNENEWIINDKVEQFNYKEFTKVKIFASNCQHDLAYLTFISQLKRKKKLNFENIKCYYPHIYSIIKNSIQDKRKSKTAFVFRYFDLVPEVTQSKIERLIKLNKRPHQKFIFSFFNPDYKLKYLFPVQIKFPTDSEIINDYTPSEVFKLMFLLLSREVGKEIFLHEIPESLTDSIIKNLNLFKYDLLNIYYILRDLFEEQDIVVDYSKIDFWYEIYFRLNKDYPLVEEYSGDENISIVSSRRESKADYLSHLKNQLSFELIVSPKIGTDDVKKNWAIKYNGKWIRDYEYSKKFIHIIKELFDNYLEGNVIDGEELNRKVDSILGTVKKSKEQNMETDSRSNILNKLRGVKREFITDCSLQDLQKHFIIKKDGCSFDPKEELGITFLYPKTD